MGSIVPVIFETWPQQTSLVFGVKSGRSDSRVSLGSVLHPLTFGGAHHLMTIPRLFAKARHAVIPASWQSTDTMISESALRFGRRELVKVRNRPVVEGPNAGLVRNITPKYFSGTYQFRQGQHSRMKLFLRIEQRVSEHQHGSSSPFLVDSSEDKT